MTDPRRFYLQRSVDVSGKSGTGRVADGVVWPDGAVAIRWRGPNASTVHWDRFKSVEDIHLHEGMTAVVWLDAPANPATWIDEATIAEVIVQEVADVDFWMDR